MNLRNLTMTTLAATGMVVALFVSTVRSQADDVETTPSASAKAYLGLQLAPVPGVLRMHMPDRVPAGQGVLITGISPQSPAENAGLVAGELVLQINGIAVDEQSVTATISEMAPGQRVTLTVLRAGQLVDLDVKLGARPAGFETSAAPFGMSGFPSFDPNAPGLGQGMPDFDEMMKNMQTQMQMVPSMREQFEQMQKQFEQLNKQFGDLDTMMPNLAPNSSSSMSRSYSDYLSISVNKTGDDLFKVAVKYKTDDGEKRELNLEGSADEVRKAVAADEKMPAKVSKQVLRSLKVQAEGGPAWGDVDMPKFFNGAYQL